AQACAAESVRAAAAAAPAAAAAASGEAHQERQAARSVRRRGAVSTLLLLLVVGLEPTWKTHFQHGRERYAAGDYATALASFEHSSRPEPLPAVWVNIAQCLRRLGRTEEAARAFRRYLDSRWGTARVRAEVWEALDDLSAKPVPALAQATRDPMA